MSTTDQIHFPASRSSSGPSRSVKTALSMVALVGGCYLLREHRGHGGHDPHGSPPSKPANRED